MSVTTFTKIINLTEESELLKGRFLEVTGLDLEQYCDVSKVISYYMDITVHGGIFEKHTTNPLDDLLDNLRVPSDYREFIENDVSEKIRDNILSDVPEKLVTYVTTQRPGCDVGFTCKGGYTFIFDVCFNQGIEACAMSSLNRNFLK